jgi:hypothetical protein
MGVNLVILAVRRPLPVYPDEQTSSESVGMSQTCHNRTHAAQQYALLFDHLVGAGDQLLWIVRSSVFAVLRLKMSGCLVGNSTGGSERLIPLTILSTYFVECLKRSSRSGP